MISIVTITKNNFSDLKKTLASIPQVQAVESIVINGGDCGDSKDLLSSHWGKVIAEPDEGISDAFNKGIQFASGDAIMFLNSGDILLEPRYPPSVDKLLNDEPGIDFVYSNMALVENGGGKLTFRKRFENIGRGMKYLHPTMIVRKKVFEQQGDFNKQYKIAMDYDFVVRMEKAGYTGRYIDGDPVVAMSEGGISIGNEKLSLYESYRSLKANNSWTIYTASGFVLRYVLFIMRRLMTTTGLTPLLKYLKRIKHS